MKYMADSLVQYILKQTQKNIGRTLRFVLPSYPPDLLLEIGKRVSDEVLKIADHNVRFEYGIAYGLGEKWGRGTEKEKKLFRETEERNWYNSTDNLTRLRHLFKDPDEDCLIVLLAGYDDIRDQASLQDFFHLDQRTLWEICLSRSFESWVHYAVKRYVNPEGNEESLSRIANIFKDLYHFGLADPLAISRYLEAKDFSSTMDGRDALRAILADLNTFGLPNMIGYEKHNRKDFAFYLTAAQKFMSYSSFIDDARKRKAKARVDSYRKENQDDLDHGVLGNFKNKSALLASLDSYIESASLQERSELAKADFVYIHDKILLFKAARQKRKREKVIKLTGRPLEVFLHALWITFADCKKENKSTYVLDRIRTISFKSVQFKHQYDNDEIENARDFLRHAIGGLDEYLVEHIQLKDSDGQIVKVESSLCPLNDEISYIPARTAVPGLAFEITIGDEEGFLNQKFIWVLGKNCQTRFLVQLYNWAYAKYDNFYTLPVFKTQYVNEMFMVTNEDDIVRILNIALEKQSGSIEDLLQASNIDKTDILIDKLYKLSSSYQQFLIEYSKAGFISALKTKSDLVRKAYCEVMSKYVDNSSESSLGPLLMKAFMIISDKYFENPDWQWKRSLKCGIVTPLHPALLEMIQHQHVYLCKSFCTYLEKGLGEVGSRGLAESKWHRLVGLARIKWPVIGLLGDSTLNTNVRSYDSIHLVGTPDAEYSTISSRLLVKYEDGDDEDVSDADLFRESQEGKLIKHVLLDYVNLHSYANDGLSIGVFCGGTIQHFISGIDTFLTEVVAEAKDVYSLNLTIFSNSPEDTGILSWIEAWKQRWHEGSSSRKHYSKSKISVLYRVVPGNAQALLKKLISQSDLDLMFFIDFTRPQNSKFMPLDNICPCGFNDYLKFPLLEKVNCAVIDGGKIKERELVLSSRRFNAGTMHAEVMACLAHSAYSTSHRQNVVISTTDFTPWESVINAAHESCVWVVCMDSVVDEKLIRRGKKGREIIGFGTGVGPHGEYNFTVSTDQFHLSDVVDRISNQIAGLIDSNDSTITSKVANSLTKEASTISGLSIVKATGPSQYVRDFIAYALVRRLLPQDKGIFCDEIVSLDAFRHWFDFGPGDLRPDLLRLQARIEDNSFKIKAQIIECKLAQQSEGYLEKALQQIEEGMKQLIPKFRPRQSAIPVGVEDNQSDGLPPDQRYWWMQLHRLISSRGQIRAAQYQKTLQALEGLSDGCYDIEWEAAAVVFWTDVPNGEINVAPQWSFTIDNQEMNIFSVQCGKEFILFAGLNSINMDLFSGPTMRYLHKRPQIICSPESEENQDIEKDKKQPVPSTACSSSSEEDRSKQAGDISVSKRILLGTGTAGGRDVYWEFGHTDLPNRHLLIFGASGTGKTYTIQAVMAELSKSGINSLIVDYTSGFTKNQLEPMIVNRLNPQQHIIRKEPLAINPFRKQCDFIDDDPIEDKPVQVAQRVSGVFAEIYNLGEQQKAVLYNAIKVGVEEAGNSFNLAMLMDKLEDIQEQGGLTANPARTILNKIKPFVDMSPFGQEDPESWERIFLDPDSKCHIIQLAGFMKDSARLITEFSLIDLYWYYRTKGSKDKPRVIVLDEIQNLDHSLDSPLGQFLTEGRKFGISLILATQTLSNLSKDERDRLFQASHKLFFKPADTEIKTFAQLLAGATNDKLDTWVQRLSMLQRGECYSLGNAYNPSTSKLDVNRAFKIKISALENRF